MAAKKVIFAVETGWKGMREASIMLARQNIPVDIIIKGYAAPEVLAVITRPNAAYRISAVPRYFFGIYLFCYILWHQFLGNLDTVIVSKERTRDYAKKSYATVKLLVETDSGYELK
ncbi:MAG: hypothetical protein NTV07_02565 [Candidatus Omnitrophica bacterium]|nr:hypothetical protein [Candidatus Omnitrophota bacterium]